MNREDSYIIRTIIHSPIVNFVFCGAFRDPVIHDIVLIKEDSIELYTFSSNGLITCISDQPLFSKIRDAKVFKNVKKTCNTDNDNVVNVDFLVTTNEDGYLSFSIYGSNFEKNQYTSQNSKSIMFRPLNIENRFYVVEEIKISTYGYDLKNLGYKIALDPLMRFIAVRDALNTVEIFRLNSSKKKGEKIIVEKIKGKLFGTILLMDFVKSLKNEKVCYLVFYIIKKKPYITLCQWNSEEQILRTLWFNVSNNTDLSMPIYLVPFLNSGDFFLNNKIIYISISQFFSGDSSFEYFDIEHKGIITAYAIDENFYEENFMNILYLGTDTGDLIYITIKNKKMNYINVGKVKPVGKVMEIINSISLSKHLIFISGDMCDNGIYLICSETETSEDACNKTFKSIDPILIQSFSNWSPVCDFKIIEETLFPLNEALAQNRKIRLCLCSGRAPNGKIAELKTGIRAKIILRVQDFNGIENFWIFRSSKLSSIYIVISFPWQTQLLELTEKGELCDRSDDTQLEQELSTISVELFNDTYVVQITQKKIIIFPLPDFKELNFKIHWLDDKQIIISSSVHDSIIVILSKTENFATIYLMELNIDEQSMINVTQRGKSIEIEDEPSSMTSIVLGDIGFEYYNSNIHSHFNDKKLPILLLVGTHKPSFIVFEIFSNDEVSVFDVSLEKFTNLIDSIPESSCLLKSPDGLVLLVGLRNGLLLRWKIDHVNGNIQLSFIDLNVFGSFPLKCISDSQLSTAYVIGDGVWMINSYNDMMEIKEIILNHQVETRVTLMLPFNDPLQESKIRSIACISKETFLMANLDDRESICVEYIDIKENPRRILYDNNLKLLVVACDLSSLTTCNLLLNRESHDSCDLKFISLTTGTIVSDNPLVDSETKEYIFDQKETIYALSDWTMSYKNKSYHYIVVGTSINNFSGILKGNLHILVFFYNFEKIKVTRINKISLVYPIYSICPIGKYGLAFSSGNIIFIKQFDVEINKFKEVSARYELESSIISIKIKGNIVYALCQKNSVVVLNYDSIKNSLKLITSDTIPRLSLDNFVMDSNIFCSDKEKGLVCLTEDYSQENKSLHLNFSVKLSNSISRFQQISEKNYYYPFIIGSGIDGSFYSIMTCPKDDFEIYQALIYHWLQFSNTNSLMNKEKFSILGENCLDGDFLETIVLYNWDNNIPVLSTSVLDYLDDDLKKNYVLKMIKLLRSVFSRSIF
ncbi:hypothetical protein PORY_000412 [Pneumocystis oryctolagi]|uniref:Uncharacterized protein n=1 Tax=Pneumocystis oryctolagi TaxID=42067 RepID=A0ACB7CJH7_9ASCO|nr:hypothetical protein PORY_000412 [Pneumocystis oryctolagi]